jgi:hypothetical protein
MAGPEYVSEFFIGGAVAIPVPDDERDGGPGGPPLKGAGEYLHYILLLPGRGRFALAWPSSVELLLDYRLSQVDVRGAPIHYRAEGLSMGFAPGGDPEEDAYGVT